MNGGSETVNIGWIIPSIGIATLVVAVGVIAIWRMLRDKKHGSPQDKKVFSPKLVALGSSLVVLGIVFGTDRSIGYSFMGAGVALSVISTIKSRRKLKTPSVEVK
jgi:hypothetical protein